MSKKKIVEQKVPITVSDNLFIGVQWDAKAIEGVNFVAQALLNLTELYKSQNIIIDSMLEITNKN